MILKLTNGLINKIDYKGYLPIFSYSWNFTAKLIYIIRWLFKVSLFYSLIFYSHWFDPYLLISRFIVFYSTFKFIIPLIESRKTSQFFPTHRWQHGHLPTDTFVINLWLWMLWVLFYSLMYIHTNTSTIWLWRWFIRSDIFNDIGGCLTCVFFLYVNNGHWLDNVIHFTLFQLLFCIRTFSKQIFDLFSVNNFINFMYVLYRTCMGNVRCEMWDECSYILFTVLNFCFKKHTCSLLYLGLDRMITLLHLVTILEFCGFHQKKWDFIKKK